MTDKPPTVAEIVGQAFLDAHDALEAEHRALSGTWLGRPRRRHYELLAVSRALRALMDDINARLAQMREQGESS